MKDSLLPASIFALALAVAFHGLPSAVAQEAPAEPASARRVICTPMGLGAVGPEKTAQNYRARLEVHQESEVAVVLGFGDNPIVCSW